LEMNSRAERWRLTGHDGPISAVAFTSDGRKLITGSSDTTALVWDLWPEAMTAFDPEVLWQDLAGTADEAGRGMQVLVAARDKAVLLCQKHLRAVVPLDEVHVRQLIADLDDARF